MSDRRALSDRRAFAGAQKKKTSHAASDVIFVFFFFGGTNAVRKASGKKQECWDFPKKVKEIRTGEEALVVVLTQSCARAGAHQERAFGASSPPARSTVPRTVHRFAVTAGTSVAPPSWVRFSLGIGSYPPGKSPKFVFFFFVRQCEAGVGRARRRPRTAQGT